MFPCDATDRRDGVSIKSRAPPKCAVCDVVEIFFRAEL